MMDGWILRDCVSGGGKKKSGERGLDLGGNRASCERERARKL